MHIAGLILGLVLVVYNLLSGPRVELLEKKRFVPALVCLSVAWLLLEIASFHWESGGGQVAIWILIWKPFAALVALLFFERMRPQRAQAGIGFAITMMAVLGDAGSNRPLLAAVALIGIAALTFGYEFLTVATVVGLVLAGMQSSALVTPIGSLSTGELVCFGAGVLAIIGQASAKLHVPVALKNVALGVLTGASISVAMLQARPGTSLATCVAIATVGAVVISFLSLENDSRLAVLAAVIAVAIGTVAFGLERTEGMSFAALTMALILVAMDRAKSLPVLGGLLGLTLYHVYRTAHPDRSEAFDIGQHYAVVGLMVGLIAPHLMQMVSETKPTSRQVAGIAVGGLVVFLLPAASVIVLGLKGLTGLLLGFGLAAVFAQTKNSLTTLALGIGAGAWIVVTLPWMEPLLDLSRDQKVQAFAGVGIVLTTLGAAMVWLLSEKAAEEVSV